jgi:hypothetical protein
MHQNRRAEARPLQERDRKSRSEERSFAHCARSPSGTGQAGLASSSDAQLRRRESGSKAAALPKKACIYRPLREPRGRPRRESGSIEGEEIESEEGFLAALGMTDWRGCARSARGKPRAHSESKMRARHAVPLQRARSTPGELTERSACEGSPTESPPGRAAGISSGRRTSIMCPALLRWTTRSAPRTTRRRTDSRTGPVLTPMERASQGMEQWSWSLPSRRVRDQGGRLRRGVKMVITVTSRWKVVRVALATHSA